MTYNNDFETAFKFLLGIEGENSYDKFGLDTYFGISKRYFPIQYNEIKSLQSIPERIEYAKKFYKENFWDKFGCNRLPYPLNILVFDTAVNLGYQVYNIKLKSFRNLSPLHTRCIIFLFFRALRYLDIANKSIYQRRHLRGWLNRISKLYWRFVNDKV